MEEEKKEIIEEVKVEDIKGEEISGTPGEDIEDLGEVKEETEEKGE